MNEFDEDIAGDDWIMENFDTLQEEYHSKPRLRVKFFPWCKKKYEEK